MKKAIDHKVYKLVTGASTGLGREFAIELARRGHHVILIALPGRNLDQLCQEISRAFQVEATYFECDLTNRDALHEMVRKVMASYPVDMLINNAGIGGISRFEEASTEYLEKIIHLNVRATATLTHLLLPELMRHEKATIINVASTAAFGPMPFKTVYPASKAFIYSFSKSLSLELHGTGVSVLVVNPGQIITNPDVAQRIMQGSSLVRIGLITPGKIARMTLDAAEKGKKVLVPGLINKFNRMLLQFSPDFVRRWVLNGIIVKELNQKKIV